MNRKNFAGLLFLAIVMVLPSCGGKGMGDFAEEDKAIYVMVLAVTNGTAYRYLSLTGELRAENEVSVYPDMPGKISSIVKFEGDYVWAGQTIAYIDRFQVGQTYALSPVVSPISGYITSFDAEVGQTVTTASAVATIGNLKKIEAVVNVPETSVADVTVGQKVLLKLPAFKSEVFEGTVYRKDMTINSLSRTLEIRVKIKNDDLRLYSGMYANADVYVEKAENVVVIPAGTSFLSDGKTYVYVNITNYAYLREVGIQFTCGDYTAITNGLVVGEEVVVLGREYLSDGSLIRPLYNTTGDTEELIDEVGSIGDTEETVTPQTAETLL